MSAKVVLIVMMLMISMMAVVECGSCSKSLLSCPDPQRKCISLTVFGLGGKCVDSCEQCKEILAEHGVPCAGC